MAEDEPGDRAAGGGTHYPNVPTVFVDAVTNSSNSDEVVKLYLSRLEPSAGSGNSSMPREVLQVVMPMTGFVSTAVFFGRVLERLIEDGTVQQDLVDKIREASSEEAAIDDAKQD